MGGCIYIVIFSLKLHLFLFTGPDFFIHIKNECYVIILHVNQHKMSLPKWFTVKHLLNN